MPPRWRDGKSRTMRGGGQRKPRAVCSPRPPPSPTRSSHRQRGPSQLNAGLRHVSPSPPPQRSGEGCEVPECGLVTAAEFMNVSEWKRAGALYRTQRELSFRRKRRVITLTGAPALAQSQH